MVVGLSCIVVGLFVAIDLKRYMIPRSQDSTHLYKIIESDYGHQFGPSFWVGMWTLFAFILITFGIAALAYSYVVYHGLLRI